MERTLLILMVQIIAGRGFNMCLCNGTGKANIELDWSLHFATCPDTACTFDSEAAVEKSERRMNKVLQELDQLEAREGEQKCKHHHEQEIMSSF